VPFPLEPNPRAWAALAFIFRLLASSVHSFEPLNCCFTFSKSNLAPASLFFLPSFLPSSERLIMTRRTLFQNWTSLDLP
jgi:hypothetical protein